MRIGRMSTSEQAFLGDLPQELIDNIVDEVRNSKISLKRCSLVSKAFKTSTDRHLFRSLVINGFAPRDRNLEGLIDFLDRSPHIRPCIRRLQFIGIEGYEHRDLDILTEFRPPIDPSMLVALHSRLPYLHTLLLEQIRFAEVESSTIKHLSSTRNPTVSLSELQMRSIGCHDENAWNRFLAVLGCFQSLDRLSMEEFVAPTPKHMSLQELCSSFSSNILRIRSLYLKSFKGTTFVLSVFRHILSLEHLEELSVLCRTDEEVLEYGLFIQASPNLRHIEFDISRPFLTTLGVEPIIHRDRLHVETLTSLESIHLLLRVYSVPGLNYEVIFSSALDILSSLPPSTSQIILHIRGSSDVFIKTESILEQSMDWDRFISIANKLCRLERITFEVRGYRNEAHPEETLKIFEELLIRV
ncbi:hypothetical protein ABKN59_011887 [Abortiporus biennis]